MANAEEDDIRIDSRLTRIGLSALALISDAKKIDFFALPIEEKKMFLERHGAEVINTAQHAAGRLGRYFEDRVVMMIECDGNAGLVFVKRKKIHAG